MEDILPDKDKVDKNLKELFNKLGIEGTVEFIERNKDLPYAKYYIEILKVKGLCK